MIEKGKVGRFDSHVVENEVRDQIKDSMSIRLVECLVTMPAEERNRFVFRTGGAIEYSAGLGQSNLVVGAVEHQERNTEPWS